MSMLVPDFAAVRYFFNYRFPHVFSAICKAGHAGDVIKCKTSPEYRACRVLAQPDWHVKPNVFRALRETEAAQQKYAACLLTKRVRANPGKAPLPGPEGH
jgi:hypothetical protein